MSFSFMDLMSAMEIGAVSYFTYKSYFVWFRNLPDIPKDYYLPIANIDLVSDDSCKTIIGDLTVKKKEMDRNYPTEEEQLFNINYNNDCFFTALYLGQMFDYWYGKLPIIDSKKLELKYELLLDKFWSCLNEECSYEDLKAYAGIFYHSYLKISGKDGGKNSQTAILS